MFRNREQARRPRQMPLWIAVSLIVLLSAGVLALSYVALTGIGSREHPGLPVKPGTTVSEQTVPGAPPLPTDAQPEPAASPAERAASQRILAMVSDTVLRATTGTCENPGTVEVSTDRAQSWSTSKALVETGATQILRLLAPDPSLIQVVALDSKCEPQLYRSADLGTTWDGPLSVLGTWYFNPSNPTQVGTPSGSQPLPCDGGEITAAGDRAAVRCFDGSIVTTVDRGITWLEFPGVTNVLAISYSPDSYVVAQAVGQMCGDLRLTTLGGGTGPLLDGCFHTGLIADQLKAEDVAIAQSDSSTLLWVGNDLFSSFDGGETWL